MDKNLGETGKRQSPINLTGTFKEASADESKQTFNYFDKPKEETVLIERDQISGKIFVKASFGSVTYLGRECENYGFFIHHPSEHTFGEN